MSRRELGIVATVVSSLVVYGLYLVIVFGMYQEGRFDTADATSLVGKAILLLMLAQIVAYIVTQIVVSAVSYAGAREEGPDRPFVDERDKEIELRENRVSFIVVTVGFISSMVVLALGGSTLLVFNLFILALTLGDVFGKLRKLYLDRRGF